MKESYDVVIVGAGWYGLAAAKAYSQLHPTENLRVLEAAESCGGAWSKNRLYPGLKSNNMVGTYEYPDFPMTEEKYGVKSNNHIPGAVLHQYLTDFAHHFGFFDRINFNTSVDLVEPDGNNGWVLSLSSPNGQRQIRTAKLILGTGLTSAPNMPSYTGQETFGALLFHAKDFCREAPSLKEVKNVVVVGGAKSAFDVAYAMVEQGATVDLIIRENGHGPVWISHPRVTPFKKRLDQILLLRWMTWFSPCPWGGEDGYSGIRNFLHGTAIGRWIVDFFWKNLTNDVSKQNGYSEHPELEKMRPWHSAFWIGSGLSIFNYKTSLFDMIKAGKIKVNIGNIDHLEPKKVVLADGTVLEADAMICATGWKKDSSIKFSGLDAQGFGLTSSEAEQAKLNNQADKDVLKMFPRLKDQPKLRFTPKTANPFRLYRFIVPPAYVYTRNLAFSGAVSSVSTSLCATIQGHWIAAYLSNDLDRLASTEDEVTKEVMLHTQWGKWRYPCGYGASLPDFVFEGLPYIDMLLRDLGLNSHRKGSWLRELTSSYAPKDFAGLVDEWKVSHVKS